jgi:16S rRNA (adenine1518-N6/adenine1519-N6)-dimethyltransferase
MPAKSRLGQNFLNDQNAIERIVAALGNISARTVVEVGPGAGAITDLLATRAARVQAIEVDHDLALHLKVHFPAGRVEVVEQDVLQFDFTAAAQAAGSRVIVVGNLPYYITSPILHRLATHHAAIEHAVLMVQREVADRVTAEPGSRDYGLLSVTTQMYGNVQRLFTLPPEAFTPPPEVHSTVFRWRFAPQFEPLGVTEPAFLRLAHMAFAQKRKTLANNLRAAGISSARAAEAIAQAGIADKARAETLSLEAFARLANILDKDLGAAGDLDAAKDPDATSELDTIQ